MARALERGGGADERLPLGRLETVGPQHDRLAVLQALEHGGGEQLASPRLQLLGGDASGQQRPNLIERQQRGPVLDQALEKAVALGPRGRGDDQQAPGRVAQAIGRREHVAVDGEVHGPRLSAVAPGAIRGPAPPLII